MDEINDLILVFCIINSIKLKLLQFDVMHSSLSIAIEFNISFIFKLNYSQLYAQFLLFLNHIISSFKFIKLMV